MTGSKKHSRIIESLRHFLYETHGVYMFLCFFAMAFVHRNHRATQGKAGEKGSHINLSSAGASQIDYTTMWLWQCDYTIYTILQMYQMDPNGSSSEIIMVYHGTTIPQFHNSFAQLEFTMHIDIFGTWTQWKGCQQHPSSIDLGLHWSSEKWHLGYRLSMLGILWGLIWDTMIYIYMINMEYYGIITINGD